MFFRRLCCNLGARSATRSGSITSNITNNGTLIASRSNSFDIPGVISGSGQVQQVSTGFVNLAANNTYTGGTIISAGFLRRREIGGLNRLGRHRQLIIDNAVLSVSHRNVFTLANAISGTGAFEQVGAGTTILTADTTYTGNTSIFNGTLQLGAKMAPPGRSLDRSPTTAFLPCRTSNSLTLPQVISGSGQFQQLGASTAVLTGVNSVQRYLPPFPPARSQIGNVTTRSSLGTGACRPTIPFLRSIESISIVWPIRISGTGQFMQLWHRNYGAHGGQYLHRQNNDLPPGRFNSAATAPLSFRRRQRSLTTVSLPYLRTNTLVLSQVISGTGEFQQLGIGTTILTADNTFTQ